MANKQAGKEIFRPYARLISVLGDQLISDKWIGVIELVKNCYDADAESVNVRFLNFNSNDRTVQPTIEISDDGDGMTLTTIQDIWMKPATPNKLNMKKAGELRFTKKKRVMQGDKGVGRFAIYKLGDHIELFTKTENSDEVKLTLDFKQYAQDDLTKKDEVGHQDKFLDELYNAWETNESPQEITNEKNQGTLIRITHLRNSWKEADLEKLEKAFFRMRPPKLPVFEKVAGSNHEFNVKLFWSEKEYKSSTLTFDKIAGLAPFYFEGILEKNGTLSFTYKHNKKEVSESFNIFDDDNSIIQHELWKLRFFKSQFLEVKDKTKKAEKDNLRVIHKPDIGSFMFFIYGFDWKNPTEGITDEEKIFLQENSIYLYRDNVRVFPYGERGVDWLMLSKLRAEDRAGNYFSYNDLIGFIFITQNENPKLRDAADREGLMNIDGAYDDFVALIQAGLKVMKDKVELDKVKEKIAKEKAVKTFNALYENAFSDLQKEILKLDDKVLIEKSKKLFEATNNLVVKVKDDLKITQELAGTGMAVEKATHDTFSLLKKLKANTGDFVAKFELNKVSKEQLMEFLIEIHESLETLYQELQVIQPLLRYARKVTKDVSVKDVVDRVQKYFRKELKEIEIEIDVKEDLIIKTNTGLVLQVILNLMDNAIYWLNQTDLSRKTISILIDGENRKIIFSDSGPGIPSGSEEVVFTEFYTTKAEGRGLGLYIVKELLERIDATINLNETKKLPGANFIIQFNS